VEREADVLHVSGLIRRKAQGGAESTFGLLELLSPQEHGAAVVPGLRPFRIDPDQLGRCRLSLGQPLLRELLIWENLRDFS